jgi:hypothetical protein
MKEPMSETKSLARKYEIWFHTHTVSRHTDCRALESALSGGTIADTILRQATSHYPTNVEVVFITFAAQRFLYVGQAPAIILKANLPTIVNAHTTT